MIIKYLYLTYFVNNYCRTAIYFDPPEYYISDIVKDLIIIGAGPAGLSCAIEAGKKQLDSLVIEKGCIVNSLYHFPENMVFFSTPENLEIGGVPFMFSGKHPDRVAALDYYRRVADYRNLQINQYEKAGKTVREEGFFRIQTETSGGRSEEYQTRSLVYAAGFFDHPNTLQVPGGSLPKVQHRFVSAHPCFGQKAAVVGGGNSAVEAALELHRSGVDVTLIHRGNDLSRGVKYWVVPDIRNRIEHGEITAPFNTEIMEIQEKRILVAEKDGNKSWIENDLVFSLIGYTPDTQPLRKMGVKIDPVTGIPNHSPETFETNISGLFVCGSIAAGSNANKIFIENGKLHGEKIIRKIIEG